MPQTIEWPPKVMQILQLCCNHSHFECHSCVLGTQHIDNEVRGSFRSPKVLVFQRVY